jgi:hypothetical protein
MEFSRQILERYSITKFNENPSRRSRVVPCPRTTEQTVMTKLIFALSHFEKAPDNVRSFYGLKNYWYFKPSRYCRLSLGVWYPCVNTSPSPTTKVYVFLLQFFKTYFDFWSLSTDCWKRLTKQHTQCYIMEHIKLSFLFLLISGQLLEWNKRIQNNLSRNRKSNDCGKR